MGSPQQFPGETLAALVIAIIMALAVFGFFMGVSWLLGDYFWPVMKGVGISLSCTTAGSLLWSAIEERRNLRKDRKDVE